MTHGSLIDTGECIENGIWRAPHISRWGKRMPVTMVGTTMAFHTMCGLSLEQPSTKGLNDPFWVNDGRMRAYMEAFLKAAGLLRIDVHRVIKPNLCHGDSIVTVDDEFMALDANQRAEALKNVDGLITHLDSVALVVRGADCPPVMLYDSHLHVVGICHSGWKGTAKKIANKMLDRMIEHYGTRKGDVFVRVGPMVHSDSFAYRLDMVEPFSASYSEEDIAYFVQHHASSPETPKSITGLNIRRAIALGLLRVGVPKHHMQGSEYFTHRQHPGVSPLFFSATRSGSDINNTDSNVFLTTLSQPVT